MKQAAAKRDEWAGAATDGRVRRSQRSREQIIAAFYDLVGEGDPEPTAQQVAERAGIGMRTVFRLFADMDALYATLHVRIMADVWALAGEVPSADADQAERVASLVAARARVFERVAPYMRATIQLRGRSRFLAEHHREVTGLLRARLVERLPELKRAPADVVEAADQATSFEAWDRLRRDQGLGRRRATAVMERTVQALLNEVVAGKASRA